MSYFIFPTIALIVSNCFLYLGYRHKDNWAECLYWTCTGGVISLFGLYYVILHAADMK